MIDSYAWIEYFRGTPAGAKARKYIEGGSAATSALTLAELREKYLKEGWESFPEDSDFVMTRTLVVPVERTVALAAGEINHSRKRKVRNWGMVDAIVLATARNGSARVITGDPHFVGLPETITI